MRSVELFNFDSCNVKAAPAVVCDTCNIPMALSLAALGRQASSQTLEVATVGVKQPHSSLIIIYFSCFLCLFFFHTLNGKFS